MKIFSKRFKTSINWTLFTYAIIIFVIVVIQYTLFSGYSSHITESQNHDKQIINSRGQILTEVIENDIPISMQIEHLYATAIALRYEMEIQFIDPEVIRPDFKKHRDTLQTIKKHLSSIKEDHIINLTEFIDAIVILENIALDASYKGDNGDFSQIYRGTEFATTTIINLVNQARKEINEHNQSIAISFTEEVKEHDKIIASRIEEDKKYSHFYSVLMTFTFIVPFAAMLFLFSQLYSRLRLIEEYATDIAHEKYALPPFVSSDPTGRLALMLCIVGRKMRASLRASREHAIKTESALDVAEKLASYDPLTGLVNRRYFNDFLKTALISDNKDNYLLFLDLDNFKDINDVLGHDIGDELLVKISNKLQNTVRPNDVVCRMGGDEFAIFLNASRNNIEQVITRTLESINSPFKINNKTIRASMSIGAVNIKPDIDTETLMKRADMAMYHAKRSGRNTFKFFTSELEDMVINRQDTMHELREALANMEFELFYQPKISLDTKRMNGYEALIRWRHPLRGLVPPDEFIPIAEDSEIIHPLGIWVLEEACNQSIRLQQEGIDLPVSINVSPKQFYAPNFVRMVESIINITGMPSHLLELEVTETILMDKLDLAIEMLTVLREMGIRISIDDFGTGYSSMKYLRDLPVDVMKIDKSFVDNICTAKKDREITSTMVDLGKKLGLEVIAEGVETADQMNLLKQTGCDTGQGYLFSKPLPFDELKKYIKNTDPLMMPCKIA